MYGFFSYSMCMRTYKDENEKMQAKLLTQKQCRLSCIQNITSEIYDINGTLAIDKNPKFEPVFVKHNMQIVSLPISYLNSCTQPSFRDFINWKHTKTRTVKLKIKNINPRQVKKKVGGKKGKKAY